MITHALFSKKAISKRLRQPGLAKTKLLSFHRSENGEDIVIANFKGDSKNAIKQFDDVIDHGPVQLNSILDLTCEDAIILLGDNAEQIVTEAKKYANAKGVEELKLAIS